MTLPSCGGLGDGGWGVSRLEPSNSCSGALCGWAKIEVLSEDNCIQGHSALGVRLLPVVSPLGVPQAPNPSGNQGNHTWSW